MPKSSFVDFKAVKAAVSLEQVLEHYGLLDKFKRSGDTLSGPCPIHKGTNPTQFRISLTKNLWNCFSECKRGGNVLDFIARMEDSSIHAAAMQAIEWFGLDAEAMTTGVKEDQKGSEPRGKTSSPQKQSPPKSTTDPDLSTANKPLKFRLEKLDQTHTYLAERGLMPETIADFGIGHCAKGMMAQRIAIPINNQAGEVVAYAGRFPGEPPADTPKYKLPPGFRKSIELFNIHRALKAPVGDPLIIVEGFFDCMKLHQAGVPKVVALMGSTLSAAQEELLRTGASSWDRIILMLDEDEAGRAGRDDIAPRVAKFAFVKIHAFPADGMQPDNLSSEDLDLFRVFGGAQ